MTLEQAIAILNASKHRLCSRWQSDDGNPPFVVGIDRYDWLEPFEAVAIAEKYLRIAAEKAREDRRACLTPAQRRALEMSDHGIPG